MSRHHRKHAAEQRAARAYWQPLLPVPCGRCRRLVMPEQPWDAGHLISAEHGGTPALHNTWPEHRRCNRAAGGRRGAQLTNARRAAERAAVVEPPTIVESTGLLEW